MDPSFLKELAAWNMDFNDAYDLLRCTTDAIFLYGAEMQEFYRTGMSKSPLSRAYQLVKR